MEVVACSHQACKSDCHEYGISLYLQCAKGTVDPEWKVTPVSGPRFCQKMSLQMVQYNSFNLHYPVDEKMRNTTQVKKRKWGTIKVGVIKCDNHIKRVSYLQYIDEKNQVEPKKLGDALGIWCYWRNIWIAWRGCIWQVVKCVAKKHTWSVRSARGIFVGVVHAWVGQKRLKRYILRCFSNRS